MLTAPSRKASGEEGHLDADGGGPRLLQSADMGMMASASVQVAQLLTDAKVTVGVDEPIEQVYELMVRLGQRFVAVSQGGRVTAVLDREQLAQRLVAAGLRHRQLFVRDVLHPGMACLPASAPLGAAMKLMRATGSSAVPVLDESHHLVGLITAKDVADALINVPPSGSSSIGDNGHRNSMVKGSNVSVR